MLFDDVLPESGDWITKGWNSARCHLLGRSAWCIFELGAHHDHRAAGVIKPVLPSQVLDGSGLLPSMMFAECWRPLLAPPRCVRGGRCRQGINSPPATSAFRCGRDFQARNFLQPPDGG